MFGYTISEPCEIRERTGVWGEGTIARTTGDGGHSGRHDSGGRSRRLEARARQSTRRTLPRNGPRRNYDRPQRTESPATPHSSAQARHARLGFRFGF